MEENFRENCRFDNSEREVEVFRIIIREEVGNKNTKIKNMQKNIKKYKQTIKKNISNIKSFLKDLRMKEPPISLYEKILTSCSNEVTSRWSSGRKYCRTFFVQQAFKELYPQKYIQLSLSLDAMVNILDDLLDEKMEKEIKIKYVLEFLRNFAVYNSLVSNLNSFEIQKKVAKYFDKLITLAIAEGFYEKLISREKNLAKVVKWSSNLLLCRAMDIDIFVEIALLGCKNLKKTSPIKKSARVFRAVNILKKDIQDIEHDLKNNIPTVVTLVISKKVFDFSEYINSLLSLLVKKANTFPKTSPVTYNFLELLKKEKEEILKLIKK